MDLQQARGVVEDDRGLFRLRTPAGLGEPFLETGGRAGIHARERGEIGLCRLGREAGRETRGTHGRCSNHCLRVPSRCARLRLAGKIQDKEKGSADHGQGRDSEQGVAAACSMCAFAAIKRHERTLPSGGNLSVKILTRL